MPTGGFKRNLLSKLMCMLNLKLTIRVLFFSETTENYLINVSIFVYCICNNFNNYATFDTTSTLYTAQ